jgi:dolichol-phosphate mannosyltransferase
MKLTVIVTVYNEVKTILRAIEDVKKLNMEKEIIVVDNCSTDGTRELLQKLKDDEITIVYQPKNYGYGQSVKTGARMATGEFIYVQYSDLEYDIECVERMLKLIEDKNLDAVFGSRLYGKRKTPASIIAVIRERPYYLGTLVTTFLTNLFYRKNFTDIIGTRCYRTSSFRKIDIESSGIAFDFEVVSKLCKSNFKIEETPVSYVPRSSRQGKKVKVLDIIPAVNAMFKVKFFG